MAERQTAQRRQTDAGEAEGRLQSLPGGIGESGPVDLDRLIHERMRLGIVSALAVNDALSFSELREMLSASDGNLSVHARRLEEAGYVECEKSFHGRVPHTEYRLTDRGRRALEEYLSHMESLIQAVREG
ncbi:MAG TPA: transcriptional regulator [Longimicrobiaceae bacterium]|nr:transcriptional regulator [Longimicrobiaceae bacterium]